MKNIEPLRVWLQHTLPTVYDDSLTYQDLLGKVLAKLNEVVESQNYVVDYVNTVDFQELVKNGLEYMVNDGTLANLINEVLFTEIRQAIKPYYCVDEFGAVGDGETDDTTAFNAAITACPDGGTITTKGKTYLIDDITVNRSINFDLNGATIKNGALIISGALDSAYSWSNAAAIMAGTNVFTANSNTNLNTGDFVKLTSTEAWSDLRSYYLKGGIFRVNNVSGTAITLYPSFPFSISNGAATIQKINDITSSISNAHFTSSLPQYPQYGVRLEYAINSRVQNCVFDKRKWGLRLDNDYNTYVQNTVCNENNDGVDTDFYGIADMGCTFTTIDNVSGHAGQHLVTTGGNSVLNLYHTCCNSNLSSITELQLLSYSHHENTYGAAINNCHFANVGVSAGTKMSNCSVDYINPGGQAVLLYCQKEDVENNFYFENCEFNGAIFRGMAIPGTGGEIGTSTVLGDIYLSNCKDVTLNLINTNGNTDFNEVKMSNCSGVAVNVGIPHVAFTCSNTTFAGQLSLTGAGEYMFTDCIFNKGSGDEWLSINSADAQLTIKGGGDGGEGVTQNSIYAPNAAMVYLSDISLPGRLYLGTVQQIFLSNVVCPSALYNNLNNVASINGTRVYAGTSCYDYYTPGTSTKYRIAGSSSGWTFTAI